MCTYVSLAQVCECVRACTGTGLAHACGRGSCLPFEGRHCGGDTLPGNCLPLQLEQSHFPHLYTPASAPCQACYEGGEVIGLLEGWGVVVKGCLVK